MKKSYYVHKQEQDNGDHEVHVADCSHLPLLDNRIYLGDFATCTEGIKVAGRYYDQVDGCKFCLPDCHRQ